MGQPLLALSVLVLMIGGMVILYAALGKAPDLAAAPVRRRSRSKIQVTPSQRNMIIIGAVVGLVAAIITGWWLLVVAVPAAMIGIPWLLRSGPEDAAIERLDALESWTRSLSGLTVSGQGLEHTIEASLPSCPEPIRPQVTQLVARINSRIPTDVALQAFADDLNDSTADTVVMHLKLKADLRGNGLSDSLKDLASAMFERIKARRDIEAERSGHRNEARIVTYFVIGLLVAMVLFQQYSAPYGTPLGQVLLAVYIAGYAFVLFMMRRVSRGKPEARPLVPSKPGGAK
jgi:tight adherence protein B